MEPTFFHYSATVWAHISHPGTDRNFDLTLSHLITCFRADQNIRKVWFQLESKNGFEHWQLHFSLYRGISGTKSTMKNWLRDLLDIEATASKQAVYIKKSIYPAASISYCQKIDTRISGPYTWEMGLGLIHRADEMRIEAFMYAPKYYNLRSHTLQKR